MQTTAHTVAPPGRAQRHVVGLFLAILLQIGLVWALVAGLTLKDVPKFIDRSFQVVLPRTDHPLPPPMPADRMPDKVFVPRPDLPPIDNGRSDTG
jgi:hypothetical protein